ncbi:hypothetical protein SBY92_002719 [Candida maltosa Xu316]|uniref:Subunit of the dynactin complex, putative n=1 Tax=Candida maltosa (strain Xu316) TaxID=1245528 RepID=M3IJL9_CANMX|nr:Subunit of the dynactin complex, putative [Candida maltosa Xu316]
MNKYSDLPGIELEGQEVFESSDIETEVELTTESDSAPDIENENIDVEHSKNTFARNEIFDSTTYDFSGNVSRINGYHVNQVAETNTEKLARIARELQEIKMQEDSTTKSTVNQMLETLNQLKLSNGGSTSGIKGPGNLLVDDLFNQKISTTPLVSTNIKNLVDIEQRLDTLESTVGSRDTSKPLQLTIQDLHRKISLLDNPEYNFGVIQEEINKLNKELEQLELKKKALNIDDTIVVEKSDKIDELYEKLPNVNKYNQLAPMLLSRLKTLSVIHQEMESTIDLSGSIEQTLENLKQDMKIWDESINKLNERIESQEENFEKNSSIVQERINDLILKVDTLSTD